MAKRKILVVAVVLSWMLSTITPSQARAATNLPILIVGATAAWVGIACLGAWLTRSQPPGQLFPQEFPAFDREDDPQGHNAIRFGPHCHVTSVGLPLVCW